MGLQRNGLLWEVFQVLPVLPNKINAMLSKVFFLSCLLAVTLAAPAADPEAAADADAYYGYGYGHGYYGYGAYHHPITQAVVTVKHHCVETPHKACITKPVTEEVENTVPHCVLEHSADCEDVEHKVPHTVCV